MSIAPILHEWAVKYAKENHIQGGFSAYVVSLINADMKRELGTQAAPKKSPPSLSQRKKSA